MAIGLWLIANLWACGGAFTECDVIALEFAIKGGPADTQHLSSEHFVAVHLFKNSLNRDPLQFFQVRAGCERLGLDQIALCRYLMIGIRMDCRWEIMDFQYFLAAESHCAFNHILQLANVSRPVILQHAFHGCRRNSNHSSR